MTVEGRDVLLFAGANYLNLAGDARVIAAGCEAAQQFGAAAGGARLINGNLSIHELLEQELAEFMRTQGALLFSTGYLANLGVITALAGPEDCIVSDSLNHASIIDACRLSRAETRVFRHNDPQDLQRVAQGLTGFRRRILVVDGVFSMEGDVAPLSQLAPIARRYDMAIVVDDAHGIGILGEEGRGSAEQEYVRVDVQIGNMGKALGGFGAFVACSETIREYLIQRARSFIFTCGLPPFAVGAARAALRILQDEPQRRAVLQQRAKQLREGLKSQGCTVIGDATPIIPLLVGDSEKTMRLADQALARGVYAQGIRHPSVPRAAARIRLTTMYGHTSRDIEKAVQVFGELS